MKNTRKGIAVPLIIGIIALIITGGIIYSVSKKPSLHSEVAVTNIGLDASVCEKFKGQYAESDCWADLGIRAQNPAFCTKTNNYKTTNTCLDAIKKKNPNQYLCDMYQDNSLGSTGCNFSLAIVHQDIALCAKTETSAVSTCIASVAELKGDIQICNQVNGDPNSPDVLLCKSVISAIQNNDGSCTSMKDQRERGLCIYRLSELKPTLANCTLINDSALNPGCFINQAKATHNLSICSNLKEIYQKGDCIKQIAIDENDENICSTISYTESRDDCYQQIATSKHDKNLCTKIQGSLSKDICHSNTK